MSLYRGESWEYDIEKNGVLYGLLVKKSVFGDLTHESLKDPSGWGRLRPK
jgi:hypothetical protein